MSWASPIGLKITIDGAVEVSSFLSEVSKKTQKSLRQAVGREAHRLRRITVLGIRDQAPGGLKFKPLSPKTIAEKGSSLALINHGDLIRSITVRNVGREIFFVGVHKMAEKNRANIAEVHEFGTKDGKIPARPFLRPSFDVWRKDFEKNVSTQFMDILTGNMTKNVRKFAKQFFNKAGKQIAKTQKSLGKSGKKMKGFEKMSSKIILNTMVSMSGGHLKTRNGALVFKPANKQRAKKK